MLVIVLVCCLFVLGFGLTPVSAQPCDGVAPVEHSGLEKVLVAAGLEQPVYVTAPAGDVNRLFIVETRGSIRIKRRGDDPGITGVFLDISSRVNALWYGMGLLGLAFDPDYDSNGFFYVNYTESDSPFFGPHFTVVARYTVGPDPDLADPSSELRLLRIRQPESNNNGGQMFFGADGYLYVTLGDGGGSNDNHGACGNAQDTGSLLGKILRLDVHGGSGSVAPDCGGPAAGYRIPGDNPLADGPGGDCDEIWAYGVHNPLRPSLDPVTGDLYVPDEGVSCKEEVHWVDGPGAGAPNFGWRVREGTSCFDPLNPEGCGETPAPAGCTDCNEDVFTDPVLEYARDEVTCGVRGGHAYRGCLMPSLAATYFYADLCAGFVRSFRIVAGEVTEQADRTAELDPEGQLIPNGFGVDAQGELYIVDNRGEVFRVLPRFTDLEVSAPGSARPLLLDKKGTWTWEDLFWTTMHPVDHYRVYRGEPGFPNGEFFCVHRTAEAAWPGGDPAEPARAELFAYIVTAVNPAGEETQTGNPPRNLSPAVCP